MAQPNGGTAWARRFVTAWWEVRWTRPSILWVLGCFIIPLTFVELAIGMVDLLKFAVDIPTVTSGLLWLVSSIVTVVAAIAVVVRPSWWKTALFIAMTLAVLLSLYVLWVDIRSPDADIRMRVIAVFVLSIAALIAAPLAPHLGDLRVRVWGVVGVVAGLTLTQFVIENQVLPTRTAPSLDVSAELEEVGRSGDVHHMRGRVTWKNTGKATAHLLAGLGTVTASGQSQFSDDHPFRITQPATALQTPPSDASSPSGYQDALLAMAQSINPVSYASGVYEAEMQSGEASRIIWMEDLATAPWFVAPGQSEAREFSFSVSRSVVSSLEFRVDAWFVTNLRLDDWLTCDGRRVPITDPKFLDTFHDVTPEAPNPCMWAPLRAGNSIRYLAEDSPYVVINYVIRDDQDHFGGLTAYFGSLEPIDSGQPVAPDEAERITRTRPVAGAAVVASWELSETTGD